MRRSVFFLVLWCLCLPVGLSITGCVHNNGKNYCSGFQSGPKVDATATIDLEPRTYGISLGYGQVSKVQRPSAFNCKGKSSGLNTFTYGTSNLNLADVSPSGNLCGGTWNRHSGNNVPDYTTCIPPQPGSAIYNAGGGVATITASGGGATSNPVPVYVHPPVTSVVLSGSGTQNPGCISQNQTSQLSAKVFSGNEDITATAGHLIYVPQDSRIVSVDQNGVATAHLPGATVISATIAQATSTAGFFFTCPPAQIKLRVGTTDNTSVTVNPNNIQPLTTTVTDTQGNPITGLPLTFTSNDPINIPVSATGGVTPVYPSDAAIVAQCLPGLCNPSPQNQIGNLSAGLPVTSNPVQVKTPGPSTNILYMASPQSYNLVPVDFQRGSVGTPIRLPYQPNSMVMDESGNYLFFGSAHEAMIVSISGNAGTALKVEAPGVPGTVLAVAPDHSLVAIHDPCRQLFYLYTPPLGASGSTALSFGAPGPTVACDVNNEPLDNSIEVNPPIAAAFTQDSQTLYIVDGNTLYTYSKFTGWHVCTENAQSGNCPIDSKGVAVTIPGVGAFAAGNPTTAFGYCALGQNNVGQTAGPPPTGVDPNLAVNPTTYYPSADTVPVATDKLAATTDGNHIIGATAAGQLTDIQVGIPAGACPLKTPLKFTTNSVNQFNLATPNIQSVNQVLISPNSQLAFTTVIPTSAAGGNSTVPAYQIPCTAQQNPCPAGQATTGKIVNVPLTGNAGSPIAGVFSPDTTSFYVSTSGDDLVHILNTGNIDSVTDTQQINPNLTCGTTTTAAARPYLACTQGAIVPAFFLASRPRPTQGPAGAAKNAQ